MFGLAGRLYVYFTYGMHYCCNIVVGEDDYGAAVLIRAVQPLGGEEIMRTRRNKAGIEVSNGPAKLCQALGIGMFMNGHDLRTGDLRLIPQSLLPTEFIRQTTRIGILRGKDLPWRFYIAGNSYVSRKR